MHLWMVICRVPFLGFLGHYDLDLVSRVSIKSGAYLLYSLSYESQIWFMDASLAGDMLCTIFGSL